MNSFWQSWWHNPTFWSVCFGWGLAQMVKSLCFFARTGRINFAYLVSTGGMPSAHCAMAGALVTSVALREGAGSSLFIVALMFAIIVMFDAQSVRRAAGLQAKLLNQIVDELFKEKHFPERKLVELLGHTRFEVVMGFAMGVLVALLIHSIAMSC